MKISNSKKQLADIIHENGGWRDGAEWAAQDKDWRVSYFDGSEKPVRPAGKEEWWANGYIRFARIKAEKLLTDWHSALISRAEYFHLYPVAETEAEPAPAPVVEAKPTIEQLAADYRNAKDYADRKRQEADAAKADAEAKLAELVAAGKALELVLSVADPEPELVITDWRDLLPGDEVEYVEGSQAWSIGLVGVVQRTDDDNGGNMNVRLLFGERGTGWPKKWRFIRRP